MLIKLIDTLINKFTNKKEKIEIPFMPAVDWFDCPASELEELCRSADLYGDLSSLPELKGKLSPAELELIIAYLHQIDLSRTNREPYIHEKIEQLDSTKRPYKNTFEWLTEARAEIYPQLEENGIPWKSRKELQLHLIASLELKQLANAHNILVKVEEELHDIFLNRVVLTRLELGLKGT